MKLKVNVISAIISLLIVAGIGYFGGPVYVLIIWGGVGLAIGAFSAGRRSSLINGALFGFAVSYSFMISGYEGSAPLSSRLLLFALLGLFGAMCGLILGLLGNKILYRHK